MSLPPCAQDSVPGEVACLLPGRELHPLEAPGFAWRTEIACYVALYDPLVGTPVSGKMVPNVCEGIIGASVGPESEGVPAKVGFPYGFQGHPKGFLYNSIPQCWNAQRAFLLAVWFRDVHPFYRHRFK